MLFHHDVNLLTGRSQIVVGRLVEHHKCTMTEEPVCSCSNSLWQSNRWAGFMRFAYAVGRGFVIVGRGCILVGVLYVEAFLITVIPD